jgi:hypothetical protein
MAVKFEGAVKPSSIEQDGYESDLSAGRITEIPSNMQMRCDYQGRTDGQPVYLGFAPRGLTSSEDGWLIQKYTYDVNNQATLRQIAYDSWDDRATTAIYA